MFCQHVVFYAGRKHPFLADVARDVFGWSLQDAPLAIMVSAIVNVSLGFCVCLDMYPVVGNVCQIITSSYDAGAAYVTVVVKMFVLNVVSPHTSCFAWYNTCAYQGRKRFIDATVTLPTDNGVWGTVFPMRLECH